MGYPGCGGSLVQGVPGIEGRWSVGSRGPLCMSSPWHRVSPVLRGFPEWDVLSLEGSWCRKCPSTEAPLVQGVPGMDSPWCTGSGS